MRSQPYQVCFIVDFRINFTCNTSAVTNRTYRGTDVYTYRGMECIFISKIYHNRTNLE